MLHSAAKSQERNLGRLQKEEVRSIAHGCLRSSDVPGKILPSGWTQEHSNRDFRNAGTQPSHNCNKRLQGLAAQAPNEKARSADVC